MAALGAVCARDARWLAARPALAVVGTRAPTHYGRKTAEALARELAEHGWCVVSGMARGIDTAAHTGSAGRRRRNDRRARHAAGSGVSAGKRAAAGPAIAESGLVADGVPARHETATGAVSAPQPDHRRALARDVVVEGGWSSGALITADYALEASRDVFAVPGPITWPKSAGPNALIRQGAKLVTGWRTYLNNMCI